MNVKYTKEILEPIIKNSSSVADVMRQLGVKRAGGSHSHLVRRIKSFEIDTTHFTGKTLAKGRPSLRKKIWQEVLILRKNGQRQPSLILRRALIESGIKYQCNACNNEPYWNGKELRLQVDHKNKNWMDDRRDNLQFLCPNCHSQTEGYNGSKGMVDVMDDNRGQRLRRKLKMAP